MPFALIFGAISAVASIAGAFVQYQGTQIQAQAAKDEAASSAKNETLRQQQMQLEQDNARRTSVRNTLAARSQAQVAAQVHGAAFGSGAAGGAAQIANHGAENVANVGKTTAIGAGIFQNNRDIAASGALAAFGGGVASLGQSISGLRFG